MNNIIKIIKDLNNKYVSIHIRRTDLTNHLKHINKLHLYTKDNDFITFLNKNTEYNIYLATDNTETHLLYDILDIFVCYLYNKFK